MKFAFARSALKPLSFFLIALCLITFSLYKLAHSKDDSTDNNSLESNLYSIAINPITDIAVVTDEKADSVSIVDANTGKTLSKVSVGKAPKGVAIDKKLNIAVVSNSYDDSISVIDLNNYQVIANIPVGKLPKGIAVNQLNHTALIANHKDETISVIDLLNYKVIKTIPIGKEPKDIAIDPALNLALIVSEQRDKGIHTVSVIDLITYQVAAEVFVGKNPQAVDINIETHLAAVANTDDNTITVIDLQTWKTSNIPVGKHPVDVTINLLNNSALVLCYEDKSLFQIDLNTNTIIKEYAVKEDSRDVSVNNFTNIAAATDNKADSLKIVQLSNPVPHINSITPPALERGISNRRITIEGAQFIKASTVLLQSASSSYLLSSIFIDNHILEAEIPEAIVARAGTYQVITANPVPEGGISNPHEFKIIEPIPQTSVPNPVPLLASISPSSIIAGSPDFTLYLTGNNFVRTAIIRFNNQQYHAKYINKTQIGTAIPSSAIKTAGIYTVEVINPVPGGGTSNAINLEAKGVSNIPIKLPEDSSTTPPADQKAKGSPSLWVGEEKKVIEVSAEDGKHILEIPAKHLEDIAVDNYRSVVWVGIRKEVIQYTLNGQEIFRYSLNIKTKDKDDDKDSNCAKGKDEDCDDNGERVVHISIDYSDGSLWIGAKDEVIKLSYDGQELFRIKDAGHIQDVSVDISNSTCWVGLKDKAIKYSQDGKPLLDFSIEDGNKIHALAAEPFSNSLWIGAKKGLIKVDENGSEQFRTEEPHDIQDLKVNTTDASLWLVTKKEVFKYSTEGKRIFRNVPCPDKDDGKDDEDKDKEKSNKSSSNDHDDDGGKDKDEDHDNGKECEGNLITLTIDPYDGSGWIAWRKAILKLSSVGEHLLWLKGFKQIEALDIGLLGLAVKITEPLNGAVVDVPSITVKGTVTDPTANVTVNGVIATVTGNIFEAQGVQLSLGNNTITAIATNLAHLTASNTIQVTYRQPLTIKINFPENGAILLTSPINVTGAVSNANARVTVNSIDAAIYENNFTAAGIGLILGENIITATATDDLGRKATDTIKVIYQPWIDVAITSPANGAVLSASPIDVAGIVNDPNAYVEVNGVQARVVAQDGRFTASGVRLYEGVNQITAHAANKLGQTDSDTVNVAYQPPSVPLSVTILSPVDGAVIVTPNITVKGAVTDPNATVLVDETLAQVDNGFFTANVYACEGPMAGALNTFEIDSWSCTITVTAYSKDGQRVISSITYTYVPLQNPLTIGITAPANNSVFTYSPIEVKGKINDALSNISPTVVTIIVGASVNGVFTVNETVATVQGDTFTAAVPLNDGINYITANAKNMVGSDAYDTIRIIYEPSTRPLSITITSPINNSIVNYSPIKVSGNVSDSTATVEINGIRTAQDFRGFVLDSLPLSVGENIITARATRPNGETVTAAIRVNYDPSYPSPPPPLLSELPQYAQAYVAVSGLTLPNYGIEIFVNGAIYEAPVPIAADSTGLFSAFAGLTVEGANRISARAIDPFGNRSALSNERIVIRDTIKPTIKNGVFSINEFALAVSRVWITAYTEAFAEVDIIFDNDPDYNYKATADGGGKFSIFTHLSTGKHWLRFTVKDRAGNIGYYGTARHGQLLLVHGAGDIPIPPMIDPMPNPINETNITVEGNAYAGFYVELYRNNELMGGMTADKRGRFRFENVSLISGRNVLKVRQIQQWVNIGWSTPSQFVRTAESDEVFVDVISGAPIRPEVKIDFPVKGAVTNSEFLPLRGIINNPDAIIRNNGYYTSYGDAENLNGRFVSKTKSPLLPGENVLWVEAISPDDARGVDKIEVYSKRDVAVPSVNITNPVAGEEVYYSYITVTGTTDNIVQKVIVNETEAVLNNGNFISDMIDVTSGYTLHPDEYQRSTITAWAIDGNGRIGHKDIRVSYKYIPNPQIYIISPFDGEILSASPVRVRGEAYNAAEVKVNGLRVQTTGNAFSTDVALNEGQNIITITARNAGKANVQTIAVTYQPASPVTLQSIAILPANPSVSLGETLQLRAIGTYDNGAQLDLTAGAVWTSSNAAIAAVYRGLVKGEKLGLATITATYAGISANTALYVGSPELVEMGIFLVNNVGLGPFVVEPPVMIIGDKESISGFPQFRARGHYSDGSWQYLWPSWTNSNPSVATLSASSTYAGFRTVTALSKGTTEITAAVGSLSAARTLTVESRISVFITSPLDGSTIYKPEVTVSGAINNYSGNETGVTVNGIPAAGSGRFVANNVPLLEGQNTITAVATDAEGNTDKFSITVNAAATGNYISLTANPESGISPMEATLKIDGTFSIQSSSISYKGPGGVEWLSSSVDEYRVRLTVEGIHTFTANAIGPDGNTIYQDTVAIVVLNRTALDNLLKGKWEAMKAALVRGEIETALTYLVSKNRDKYRQIFTLLQSNLSSIATNMQPIQLIYLKDGIAKYRIRRQDAQGEITYYIYFEKDKDGIWRIRRY